MEAWVRKSFWIFALMVYLLDRTSSTAANSYSNCTQRTFEISCDDGEIFDVDVTSAVGKCGNYSCTGDTPQLIMQKLNCHWKNNCTIDFPKDIIIHSTSDSSECIGEKPNVLVLYSWKCTRKGVNINDLKTSIIFNIGDRGILRSHSRFPWVYSGSDFNRTFNEPHRIIATFWLTSDFTVTMTVYKFNVTYPDTLTWYTKQNTRSMPASMGTVHFDQSSEKVYLQLNLSQDSKGDSGFLICFAYSSSGGTIQNACSDLTTTHYNAKTREKKIKKPKGKKEEKWKNKKGKGKGTHTKKEFTTRKPQRQSSG